MQAERDYLRTRIFPELEERLRSRRHNLEWVDLRVGVATASQQDECVRELHVLKVCLDEVRRCRPFLIVLLGDRYGWVPPAERIQAAAEEARKGFSADVAGRSVTDLEIDFGILSNHEQQPRSLFYFREPLPYAEMPPATAALYSDAYDDNPDAEDRVERLAALKRRIERQLPERVRHYDAGWDHAQQRVTGIQAWGLMVLEDIWSEFEAEIGRVQTLTEASWQDVERAALADFVDDRSRDFVGRRSLLDRLTKLDNQGTPWATLVTGDPGSGKSALFGELYRHLNAQDVFLLAHSAGASVQSASVNSMLRRWVDELAEGLGLDSGLPEGADPDAIDARFATLLVRMAQRRSVYVLIDALDQFEPTTRASYLTWLPRIWPPNAHLVATAIPGQASLALEARAGTVHLLLSPLESDETRDIIAGICSRYHRTFEPEVIDALLSKAGPNGLVSGNPLWLVMAVEELNLLDSDDFAHAQRAYSGTPAEQLRTLMLQIIAGFPTDIPKLYDRAFERAEALFGADVARGFLGLIAVSRSGWRESDFRILLPRVSGESWDGLRFAQLRRLFRGQMRQRGAPDRWDFNHAQMRVAVHARLAALDIAEPRFHALIVDRLLSCRSDDPLRISETMIHLLGSEDWRRAAKYYGSSLLTTAEIDGATSALALSVLADEGGKTTRTNALVRVLDTTDVGSEEATELASNIIARCMFDLTTSLEPLTSLQSRLSLADSLRITLSRLNHADPDNTDWRRQLLMSHIRIGDLKVAQANVSGGLESYATGLDIAVSLTEIQPDELDRHRDLSLVVDRVGNIQFTAGDLTAALATYRHGLEIAERLARAVNDDVELQRDLSVSYRKVADVLVARGDLTGGLGCYRDSLEILDRLARSDPNSLKRLHDLSTAFNDVGRLHLAQDDLAGAIEMFRDGLSVREKLARSNPGNWVWQRDLALSYQYIGEVQSRKGCSFEAFEAFGDSFTIFDRLVEADLDNVDLQEGLLSACNGLGDAKRDQSDYSGALAFFGDSLAVAARLVKLNPDNAAWQRDLSRVHNKIGDVKRLTGDTESALICFREGLCIVEQIAKSHSDNAEWQHQLLTSHANIGNALKDQGDLAESLQAYYKSLAVSRRLTQSNPDATARLRDLMMCLDSIGEIQTAQGDFDGALTTYRDSSAVALRLSRAASGNEWQQSLSVSHLNVGDTMMARRDFLGALQSYGEGLIIRAQLAELEPSIAARQRDLSVAHERVGDAQTSLGDFVGSLASYRESLSIREHQTKLDPGSSDLQQGLSIAHGRVAQALLALGDSDSALTSFRSELAVANRLARTDPGNCAWQRQLSLAHSHVGNVLLDQERVAGALASYRAGHAISDRLAKSNPDDTDCQRDLMVAFGNIGYAQMMQGDLLGAQNSYRDGLAIANWLAKSSPEDLERQHDLAISYYCYATVSRKAAESAEEIDALRQGRSILLHATERAPANATFKSTLGMLEARIAELTAQS